MKDFDGRVVLVTGAARGQGRCHVLNFAQQGARVVAVDVCRPDSRAIHPIADTSELDSLASEVRELGGEILTFPCDVTDRQGMKDVAQQAVTEFGRLDVVIANAALFNIAPTLEMEGEVWDRIIEVTLTGVWNTFAACTPHVKAAGNGGSLIAIGSTAAGKGIAGAGAYVAAKHGVVGLVKTLAQEYGPDFIRFNMVSPSSTNTTMLLNDDTRKLFIGDSDDEQALIDTLVGTHLIPVPWVEPQDISDAVLFLASDRARYITGTVLPVDAGYLAK